MDCTIFTHPRFPYDFEAHKSYTERLQSVKVPKRNGGRARCVHFRLPRDDGKRRIQLEACREIQQRIDDTDSGYTPLDVQIRAEERTRERGFGLAPRFGVHIPRTYRPDSPLPVDRPDSGYASSSVGEAAFEGRRHIPRKGIRQDPEPDSPRDGTPIPELPRRQKRQETRDEEGRTAAERVAILEANLLLQKVGLECWVSPSGKRQE